MLTTVVNDSITFTLNEADLSWKKVGDVLLTPKHATPRSNGLEWWIDYRPAGNRIADKGHVSIFMWVNKPVKARYTVAVDGSSISQTTTCEFPGPSKCYGWSQFASHESLRPLFRGGKIIITCNVDFDIVAPVLSVPRVFQLFHHIPMDIEIVVGSERLSAHKSFLSLISPVFHAILSNDSIGIAQIEILEFDFTTVKAAIGVCYGHELKEQSLEIVISILRFCVKYFITAVIEEFERLPFSCLSTQNFCLIVHYAFDCNRDALLTECGTFFKEHMDKVKALEEFGQLPPTLIVDLLKSGFDLNTNFDVLRHAHEHGFDSVMKHFEEPLTFSMTFNDFFPTVNYAWECSREDVKQACAKYLNANRDEVLESEAFHDLPPETLSQLLKASFLLRRGH
uniref:BTB domain-containing protein n=1 Tax=Panagrellus redivivus TaxID=6233 RepID=A0A7E4W4E8_PANRE